MRCAKSRHARAALPRRRRQRRRRERAERVRQVADQDVRVGGRQRPRLRRAARRCRRRARARLAILSAGAIRDARAARGEQRRIAQEKDLVAQPLLAQHARRACRRRSAGSERRERELRVFLAKADRRRTAARSRSSRPAGCRAQAAPSTSTCRARVAVRRSRRARRANQRTPFRERADLHQASRRRHRAGFGIVAARARGARDDMRALRAGVPGAPRAAPRNAWPSGACGLAPRRSRGRSLRLPRSVRGRSRTDARL